MRSQVLVSCKWRGFALRCRDLRVCTIGLLAEVLSEGTRYRALPRHRAAGGIPPAVVTRPAQAGVPVLQCRVCGRILAIVPVVEVALWRQFCG